MKVLALLAACSIATGCSPSEGARPPNFGADLVAMQIVAAEKACAVVNIKVLEDCATSTYATARAAAKTAQIMTETFAGLCSGDEPAATCENMLNNAYVDASSK